MSKLLIDNIFQNDWKVPADPDPFETFVRETRAAAGIVDPPRQPVCGGGQITTPFWKILDGEGLSPEDYEWDGKNYTTYGDLDKS